jgi:hypothetical protein
MSAMKRDKVYIYIEQHQWIERKRTRKQKKGWQNGTASHSTFLSVFLFSFEHLFSFEYNKHTDMKIITLSK